MDSHALAWPLKLGRKMCTTSGLVGEKMACVCPDLPTLHLCPMQLHVVLVVHTLCWVRFFLLIVPPRLESHATKIGGFIILLIESLQHPPLLYMTMVAT